MEGRQKLETLICGILNKTGPTPKVKLAKLILFSEIEHFNRTGDSITGIYFVRLKKGPMIAFYNEVLKGGIGRLWKRETEFIPIYEEGKQKAQYSFSPLAPCAITPEVQDTIDFVIKTYGSKTGTELSNMSHKLPAWTYSEPNEPIFIAELAAKDESEYFMLTDLVEDINDDSEDDFMAEAIPGVLSPA